MGIKHYIDIEALREEDIVLDGLVTRGRNDHGFREGDMIYITEKIDGSNASVSLDPETGKLEAFSHKNPLSPMQTLNGVYNYAIPVHAETRK